MLKLTTFEIQQRWQTLAVSLGLYQLANIIIFWYIQSKGLLEKSDGAILVTVFMLGGVIVCFSLLESVNALRLETKRATRDLYFSLPFSGYKKIGSKLLISILSIAIISVIAAATTLITIEAISQEGMIKALTEFISENMSQFLFICTIGLIQMLSFIATIYLALGIHRSFFSQFRFGGAITFAIYLGLNFAYVKVFGNFMVFNSEDVSTGLSVWQAYWPQLATISAISLGAYGISGYLFDKRANFDS